MVAESGSAASTHAPATAASGFRRRRFIVDPKLQFKIVFHLFLVSSLIGISGALLASLYFLHRTAARAAYDMGPSFQVVFLALSIATSALLVIAIAGIFISHGIAGPIHRFRQIMRAVAEKRDAPPAALRRHDYLQAMAQDFDVLLAALKAETAATARAAREASDSLGRTIAALEASGKADPALLTELSAIRERLARIAGAH